MTPQSNTTQSKIQPKTSADLIHLLSRRSLIMWGMSFQILWFLTVELASQQHSLWAAFLNLTWTSILILSQQSSARMLMLKWGLVGLLIGCLGDGACILTGLYIPVQPMLIPIAPLWLLSLWISFATFTPLSLGWMLKKPLIAISFGILGGPFSYLAGVRWGAMHFGASSTTSLVTTGILWGLAMFLAVIGSRSSNSADEEISI